MAARRRLLAPHRVARYAGALSVVALIAAACSALPPSSPASATVGPPTCSSGVCTLTFPFVGSVHSWTVPAGVTSASFTLYGARGGSAFGSPGGLGAEVQGTLFVVPGDTVSVDVGGAGGDAPGGDEPLAAASRLLWSSCAAQLGDDTDRARHHLDDALRLAEPEGLCEVFLESGREVLRQLAALLPASGRPRLADKIWVASPRPRRGLDESPRASSHVEALSERELTVLRHLDRDLDEEEPAAALYISVNTLKTHLKHIYRKVGVRTRLQAVLRASDLGLLQT